jgi:hypothetical protein
MLINCNCDSCDKKLKFPNEVTIEYHFTHAKLFALLVDVFAD